MRGRGAVGGAGAVLLAVLCAVLLRPGTAAADTGPWAWPLAGPHEVSRPFAPPAVRYGSGHRGADLPASPGAVVRAAGAGRVSYAGLLAGRGVVVVVHGALRTTYEPVTAAVAVGASVPLGAALGTLQPGHAGCPVAACLHWGLRRGEDYLDPVRLVDRGPVRLLPVEGAAGGLPAGGDVGAGTGAADAAAGGAGGASGGATGGPSGVVSAGAGRPGAEDDGRPPAPSRRDGPAAHVPPAAVERGAWSLRGADAPLGAAAVVALVAGIGLLARPRPGPAGPSGAAGGAVGVSDPEALDAGPVAPVVELGAERLRRRTG